MAATSQRPLSGTKLSTNKTNRDTVAPSAHITKSYSRPSHNPSPLKKAASARAPRPSERFQLSDNKFSKAPLKEKDKNAALASKFSKQWTKSPSDDKAKPLTKASLVTKERLTGEKQSNGAASKNNRLSCTTQSRAAKRLALDDQDDSDDDLPHNGVWRNLKKRKLNSATASSNPVAPSTATGQGSNGTKKRSAPDDAKEEPSSKRQKSNLEHEETRNATASNGHARSAGDQVERDRRPRGLYNADKLCFSNAFIQMFDTACDGHDIDSLLGKDSDVELLNVPPRRSSTRASSKKPEARSVIERAVRNGETAKVSPSKHFRSLLGAMHQDAAADGAKKDFVSPWAFQQVFAWGELERAETKNEKLTNRQKLSGKKQADCLECYQKVLEVLSEDEHLEDEGKKNLKDLFEFQTYSSEVCSDEDCPYKSKPNLDEISNSHNVNIPSKGPHRLRDLYERSLSHQTDKTCPHCSSSKLETRSVFQQVGETLIMSINRIKVEKQSSSKIMTDVKIDLDRIRPYNKSECELSAVICHDGPDMDKGHYTICRKYNGKWFYINDRRCEEIKREDVANAEKYGQSTMILWKKMAA